MGISDRELHDLVKHYESKSDGGVRASPSNLVPLALRELVDLRSAKAADRERVVSEVVHQFYVAMRTVQHGMTEAERSVAAAEIASRVADAIAVPDVGLSDDSRRLVREIVQREYDRVPADPKYDWERTRLADCLKALGG